MATRYLSLRIVKRVLASNFRKNEAQIIRTIHTSNAVTGEFLVDTTNLARVQEEAKANPFPVRYMEFMACQQLYETFARHGMNKPASGLRFNAAYIDTHPDAKKSMPIVVCLHGCPGGHWDFNHLTTHLANKGYRVIVPNFPGYGWTKMDESYQFENSSEEKASFVKDFLYCLGIEKVRMGVVHSAAVYPAFLLSSEILNTFQSVALINPGGLGVHNVLRPYSYLRFHSRFYRNPILRPFLLSGLKLTLLATGFGNTNAIQMSVAVESLSSVPYEEYKSYPMSMALRKYPAVLIHSKNDRAVELKLSMQMGAMLAGKEKYKLHLYDENGRFSKVEEVETDVEHVEHHVFASGGHFLMKRYPDTVNEIVENFLENVVNRKVVI